MEPAITILLFFAKEPKREFETNNTRAVEQFKAALSPKDCQICVYPKAFKQIQNDLNNVSKGAVSDNINIIGHL
ncbi:hypothetical protein MFLAVUS_006907 [Mucor flavus]|uniref:Uncharacterized protein n=1 Tax=Mucor flavus TaxID=439312 RepID=A0ABP9Z2U7_9FUNG